MFSNKHITIGFSAIFLSAAAFAGEKKEEHFDVWIQLVDGQIVTGAIDEAGVPLAGDHRVFGAEFGEDPLFPFAAFEPGFQAIDGTFDPFTMLQFNIVDSLGVWNGDGFDTADETMTLEFGPASATTGDGFTPGFAFGMDDEGGFHGHFDLFLNAPGNGEPGKGIYLLTLELIGAAGQFGSSDPFWFVMNLGLDEREHEAAISYVENVLVPAPTALASFAMVLLTGRGRKRSRS